MVRGIVWLRRGCGMEGAQPNIQGEPANNSPHTCTLCLCRDQVVHPFFGPEMGLFDGMAQVQDSTWTSFACVS